MSRELIYYAILFVAMLLLQALICNHIVLFNVAVPIIFIYFIIRLPMSLSTNWVLTLSFLMGFCVDIFSDTPGMNALACTIFAIARRKIFTLYNSRDEHHAEIVPSISTLGFATYCKYLLTTTLCYCTLIFLIEYFSFSHLPMMLFKIVSSSVLTFLLLLGIDSLMARQS